MKKILFILIIGGLFITFSFFITDYSIAQTKYPPPIPASPAQETPIDGGLGILAAAGGAYAIKKLRDKKK